MLSEQQRRRFAVDGYLLVPGVVDEALLAAADAEIDALERAAPPPPGTVGPHFHFVAPADLPAADAALRQSSALATAEELTAPLPLDHALDHIQVAFNLPPFAHRPGAPHIDGHRPDEPVASFTMLAAIFLSDESTTERGNLWVWPGSHRGHQQLFAERGIEALVPVSGQAILLDPPGWLGSGEPLLAHRGDLLLAHYLLGHNIGGNTSPDTRRVLYFRLAAEGHSDRWQATFADPFTGYVGLAGLVPAHPFVAPPPRRLH